MWVQSLSRVWWVSHQVVSDSFDPVDCSPPVHEILQARILEWVAISFSRGIFPTQRLKLGLLYLQHLAGRFFTTEPLGKPLEILNFY